MKKSNDISNEVARRWTESAVDCYKIGCQCGRCNIPNIMETPCQMKKIVIELVRKFGRPAVAKYRNTYHIGE